MATFPRTEATVAGLARRLIGGLRERSSVFPNPPVSVDELQGVLDEYKRADAAVQEAKASVALRYKEKAESYAALVDCMKSDIRYAENTVDYDDAKLTAIGWGGRRRRRKLEVPGQTRSLEVLREGPEWIKLDWKKPDEGGKVAAFKVQCRSPVGDGAWRDVGVTSGTEIVLHGQERGVALTYQVIAVNKAGEGGPSNLVGAVL